MSEVNTADVYNYSCAPAAGRDSGCVNGLLFLATSGEAI